MKRSAFRLSAKRRRLLLAEENPGKNDPEGEESGESSSGGDGYHWLVSSEIVMIVVSGQVVTSCLRRCKIFVTSKFPPGGGAPPSGMAPHLQRNRPMPGASDRHRATGERRAQRPGMKPPIVDYLIITPDEFPRQNDPQGKKSQECARSSQSKHFPASRNMN